MSLSDDARPLTSDLHEIFGDRLRTLVAYQSHGPDVHTLAIVDDLSSGDLAACAAKVAGWHERRLATPLLLAAREFERSLDAFPLEFGAIVSAHTLLAGTDPFATLTVDADDVRRACEIQARSHLLHLREGYIETGGEAERVAALIVGSAAPFAALLRSIERLGAGGSHLSGGIAADVVRLARVREIAAADAQRIFPEYLAAVERLVAYVDGWSAR